MLEDIWSAITTGGGSLVLGGITGLFGTVITKFAEYKQRQQDLEVLKVQNAHELAVKDADAEIVRYEWEGRDKVAMTEAAAIEAQADANAMAASFKLEPAFYSSKGRRTGFVEFILGVLDFIRGSMRPGLTIYLGILVTLIYWQLSNLVETTMDAGNLSAVMVHTFLYLFTTCVCWWFGTRNKQSPPQIIR